MSEPWRIRRGGQCDPFSPSGLWEQYRVRRGACTYSCAILCAAIRSGATYETSRRVGSSMRHSCCYLSRDIVRNRLPWKAQATAGRTGAGVAAVSGNVVFKRCAAISRVKTEKSFAMYSNRGRGGNQQPLVSAGIAEVWTTSATSSGVRRTSVRAIQRIANRGFSGPFSNSDG